MATAAELLRQLAGRIDAHAWDGLAALLHPDFICRYAHTGEVLDADKWVRLNAEYPGFGHLELLDVVACDDRAVGRAHITGGAGSTTQEFEVCELPHRA